jgi:hypothetical protein
MENIINELVIYYILLSIMVMPFNLSIGLNMILGLLVIAALMVVVAFFVTLICAIRGE